MKYALPTALIALGFLSLILASFWVQIMPPTRYWTNEDVARLDKLNDAVVQAYYELDPAEAREIEARLGKHDGPLTPYEEAVESRNRLRSKRTSAINRPREIAAVLHWGGLGAVAAGAIALYTLQQLK